MSRRSRHLSCALGLALLATACQAPGDLARARLLAPSFRMQAVDGGVAGQAAVQVSPAGLAAGNLAPAPDGVLTVRFDHLTAARKLLATIADVESLTIHLAGTGVGHTETISRAMIVGGMTSFTFTGLPAGTLTVTIRALDAGGRTIGSDVREATVTAGQTTVVASTVLIAPTVTQPRVIAAGGSGGSGGGATGSLTTNVTLQDGTPVTTPALLGVFTNSGYPHAARVEQDNVGNTWFTGGLLWGPTALETSGVALKRIDPTGAVTVIDTGHSSPYDLAVRPDGGQIVTSVHDGGWDMLGVGHQGFLPDGSVISELDAVPFDGVNGSSHGPGPMYMPLAIGADGRVFTGDLVQIWSYLPGGAGGGPLVMWGDLPDGPFVMPLISDVTSTGDLVVTRKIAQSEDPSPSDVLRIRLDGTIAFDYNLPGANSWAGFDLDAQDNVWCAVPSQRALIKLSPTGTLLGTYPMPVRCNSVHIDPTGRIWAYQAEPHTVGYNALTASANSGAPDDLVMRVGTDGIVQAFYHIGLDVDIFELQVTADDHMWVASGNKGLLHLELP